MKPGRPLPKLQMITALREFADEGPAERLAAALFTGRDDEVDALAVAVTRMHNVNPRSRWAVARDEVWLVTGAEGSGKSALVNGILDRYAGLRVNSMTCPAESIPLDSPDHLASFLADALSMPFNPVPGSLWSPPEPAGPEARRLEAAERKLWRALPDSAVLLLMIEDLDRLQADDSPGRKSTFGWLFGGVHGMPIVTVITARESSVVAHAGLDPGKIARRWLKLGALDPACVDTWCRRFFRTFDPDGHWAAGTGIDSDVIDGLLRRIQALSGGWPGRVQHCLAALAREWAAALEEERDLSVTTVARQSVLKRLPNDVFCRE